MSENFTIFPKPDGALIIAKGELKGVALSPTLRGMEGESPVETTMAFCAYLETMLGKVDEFGEPLFKLNPSCKVVMSSHKTPTEGEEWTFGIDDRMVINKIKQGTTLDGNGIVYEFYSDEKKSDYAVCRLSESDIPEDHLMIRKLAANKYRPIVGEWNLTVRVGNFKPKNSKGENNDPRWISSYFLNFVDIVPVKGK